jgi:hypothetical protein
MYLEAPASSKTKANIQITITQDLYNTIVNRMYLEAPASSKTKTNIQITITQD